MKFTKTNTLQIKGIAIVLMLFHHCFLNAERWATVPYEMLSDGRMWEVLTARYFSAICLPDCTVMHVTA